MAEENLSVDLEANVKNLKALQVFTRYVTDLARATETTSERSQRLTEGIAGLTQALGGSNAQMTGVTRSLGNMTGATALLITKIAILTGGLLLFGKLVKSVTEEAMNYAFATNDMARRTGMTVDQMNKMNFVAFQSGMTFDELSKTVEVFDLKMSNMTTAGKKTKTALDQLGVAYKDLNGNVRTTFETMDETLKMMEKMSNQDVSEVGTDIGGRLGSARLIRIADDYTKKMEKATEMAEKLSSFNFNDWLFLKEIIFEIQALFQILKLQIGIAFKPIIEQVLPAFRGLLTNLVQMIGTGEGLSAVMGAFGTQIAIVIDKVSGLMQVFVALWNLIRNFFLSTQSMGETWKQFFQSIGKALMTFFGRIFFTLFEKFSGIMEKMFEKLIKFNEFNRKVVIEVVKFFKWTMEQFGGFVDSIVNAIMRGIVALINKTSSLVNQQLDIVNTITGTISKLTDGKIGATTFQIKEVKWTPTDKTYKAMENVGNSFLNSWNTQFDNAAGRLEEYRRFFAGENPFANWIDLGGTAGQSADSGADEYQRALTEVDNLGKSAEKLNKELDKQAQMYNVIYGTITGSRRSNFFNLLGQTAQPFFPTTRSAGITYSTVGGLTSSVNVQNMTVRTEADIYRIANELNKINKRELRKTGNAYSF